jgi:hypothetical protein
LIVSLLALGCGSASARADGGTVRLLERVGGYQITVFTAPQPFRAGPVDISVLVQDAATGAPVPDAAVAVSVAPVGQPAQRVTYAATRAAATNKLFQAAKFDLPAAGWWEVRVQIDGVHGQAEAAFQLEAAEPVPQWVEMWLWIGWPAVPIVLFGVRQMVVRRVKGPQPSMV